MKNLSFSIVLVFIIMSATGCSSTNNKEAEGAATVVTAVAVAAVTAPLWGPVAIAETLIPDGNKEKNIDVGVGDTKDKVESLLGQPELTYSCSSPNYEVWEYAPPLN